MGRLALKDISKKIENKIILEKVCFEVNPLEHFFLLGESGAGKTQLLSLISGFSAPTTGTITYNNKDITRIQTNKRPFNTIFQNFVLFPHLNVFENIAFSLRLKNHKENSIIKEVEAHLSLVGLEGFSKRKISSLSGGEQQRVAIARALINKNPVLLLDEPLSALDAKVKSLLIDSLKKIKEKLQLTFIHVTHDQKVAFKLADRVAIIKSGQILQIDTPLNIYENPINRYIANFIGEINWLTPVKIKNENNYTKAIFENNTYFKCITNKTNFNNKFYLGIRPENIEIFGSDYLEMKEDYNFISAKLINKQFLGDSYQLIIDTKCGELKISSSKEIASKLNIFDYIKVGWKISNSILVTEE